MAKYKIFTDATSDLTRECNMDLSTVEIIPMIISVDGKEYTYGDDGNLTIDEFYGMLRSGKYASTAAINPSMYAEYFEPALKEGMDILYLCFSSGMSSMFQNALSAAEILKESYPDRTIICMDTLCAALGEGLFVLEAASRQKEGMKIEELSDWLYRHRLNLCHWFAVDRFDHLLHGGRVSIASAAVGTILDIKPILHVDNYGKLEVVTKVRGYKKAIRTLTEKMRTGWCPEISKGVLIGHGNDPKMADLIKDEIAACFPEADIRIIEIGPVIGAHTGPGMFAVLFWGNAR